MRSAVYGFETAYPTQTHSTILDPLMHKVTAIQWSLKAPARYADANELHLIAVYSGYHRKMVAYTRRAVVRYGRKNDTLLHPHLRRPRSPQYLTACLMPREVKPLCISIAVPKRGLLGHEAHWEAREVRTLLDEHSIAIFGRVRPW